MIDPLEQITSDACVELFAACGATLTPARQGGRLATRPPSFRFDERTTGCVVDIVGNQMRGALVLVSSFELIAASRPPHGRAAKLSAASAADWLYVRDWTKELGNQLVGRIKNRLWSAGYTVMASLPTIVSGTAAGARLRGSSRQPLSFISDTNEVHVLLDVAIPADVALRAANSAQSAQAEGDVVLF